MAEGEAVVLLQSLRIDHGFTAVEYDHGKHHQACKDICTDVYGGKDYMPRMLESYAADENTLMLVATRKGDGAVGGIVCADRRGSIVFLFGLRVCSKFRGRGLASMLVAAASEGVPGAFPQATALMTVTIDANAAAVALFSKALSPAPLYTAEAWPPWTCTYAFESALGWPEKQAGPGDSIIDAVYGARELLCGDAEAAAQLPRWRPTRDVQELSAAVADIRGGGGAGSGSDTGGEGVSPPARCLDAWLPGMYEVQPIDGPVVAEALADGRVWLLPEVSKENDDAVADWLAGGGGAAGSSSADTPRPPVAGYAAALLMFASKESRGRTIVGLVVRSPSAVHSGILLTARTLLPHAPHFTLFVSRAPGCEVPGVFGIGPGGTEPEDIARWSAYGRQLQGR